MSTFSTYGTTPQLKLANSRYVPPELIDTLIFGNATAVSPSITAVIGLVYCIIAAIALILSIQKNKTHLLDVKYSTLEYLESNFELAAPNMMRWGHLSYSTDSPYFTCCSADLSTSSATSLTIWRKSCHVSKAHLSLRVLH